MKKIIIFLLLLTPAISVATPPVTTEASPFPTCFPCPDSGTKPVRLAAAPSVEMPR